jgi:hypothetical protein
MHWHPTAATVVAAVGRSDHGLCHVLNMCVLVLVLCAGGSMSQAQAQAQAQSFGEVQQQQQHTCQQWPAAAVVLQAKKFSSANWQQHSLVHSN